MSGNRNGVDDRSHVRHSHDQMPVELSFATWLARNTSRRSFIRGLLKGALVVGASGGLVGAAFAQPARAGSVCYDPPGDSPYCNGACCDSSTRNCKNTSTCRGRNYGGATCQSTGGCWSEYEGGWAYLCCDCCTKSAVGTAQCTTNCPSGTWYRCICEFWLGVGLQGAEPSTVGLRETTGVRGSA